jgi:hypothetical protein
MAVPLLSVIEVVERDACASGACKVTPSVANKTTSGAAMSARVRLAFKERRDESKDIRGSNEISTASVPLKSGFVNLQRR